MRDNQSMLPARDAELLRIIDNALEDANARGGPHLACRPGCTPCCHGLFRISALDAARLRQALETLTATDPARANAIRARGSVLVDQLAGQYPGDPATGRLWPQDDRWDHFADLPQTDAACPVLDPATGRCELYSARPLTCRLFGPPVRTAEGIGMCELCYVGANEEEILHGEMHLSHVALEEELDQEFTQTADPGETVIAWALLRDMPSTREGP